MGFITKSHLIVISEAARKGNFSVSFRDTGTDALEWLDKGAATKPHSILEKTLKSSRVQPGMLQAVKDSGLQGLAAHWEGATPIGVFVTRAAAAQWQQSTMPQARSDGKGNFYAPIDFANPQDANLAALKSLPNWERTVVTGDYDLHDMISFTGQRHAVSVESSEENFIRKAINEAVATVQPHRSEAGSHTEHRMVQHGPQANYPAFVSTREPDLRQKLAPAVALPSVLPEKECRAMVAKGETPPSLAICNRGEWSIVSSQEQLAAFYEKQGARIKVTWQPGEKSIHFGQIGKHGFGLTRGRA
ncbi:hypothetical protein E5C26_20345 [Serratia proteamaculans]|uniref:hypothetical protein n=1 Tax=Serratia proteamaculans TaxID=28151 RepID=UPI001075E44B|nr:hypothetical protein [Serratia proteamaculans]TFZ48692.1 hypothetical protein E5C26_20345 [Serratia proteamaculans]